MRKIVIVFLLIVCTHIACIAASSAEKLLALVKLSPENVTRDKITAILGKPSRVEESKKGTKWYYTVDNYTKLTLQWNKKTGQAEQFSFSCKPGKTCIFDKKNECQLKEGFMSMQQAVTLLGPPKEMTVKEGKQVMFYYYEGNMLRLFFRNRTLVDYALVENRRG